MGKLAFISDRIVKSSADEFTLDVEAFVSAINAAKQAQVDFLWLDCWCYRKQPPWSNYVHSDFVVHLPKVSLAVDIVIWLLAETCKRRVPEQGMVLI